MSVDFAAVQWARRMAEALGPLRALEPGELSRLAPLLEADPPGFPFVALLVSGGHTMLVRGAGLGRYQ